ncbi:creatininase family protein [Amycolatopsis sp. NPDC059021]|uniref:creatininase family protein n=1 Tax=Amycolatopsis sp. NPDC059021 TaxID=3346704 RepID=UPI003670EDCA
MTTHFLPRSTTIDERDRGATVAVLPVGSFEQHGEFLPLATDTAIAVTITQAIADVYPVLQLPPITISCSHEHATWPGTVSISAKTLYSVVQDIAESLRRSGVGGLVLVNGHGGNYVLSNVVQEAHGSLALFPMLEDWQAARTDAGLASSIDEDMHAGELETSVLLHAHPDLVRAGYATADVVTGDRRRLLTTGLARYTESGVAGRPSLASAEKGRAVIASLVTSFADCLSVIR